MITIWFPWQFGKTEQLESHMETKDLLSDYNLMST